VVEVSGVQETRSVVDVTGVQEPRSWSSGSRLLASDTAGSRAAVHLRTTEESRRPEGVVRLLMTQ
jgi:hypothetical protein